MNGVNKTLYIPLYGKAYVSKKGLFLDDKKAEEIWEAESFKLRGKAKSKWLAYYMGIRSAVFDGWLKEKMGEMPEANVIHIGCGMDSRVIRVGTEGHRWFDLDFPDVIEERKRYYKENGNYTMLAANATDCDFTKAIPEGDSAIVVMEGVSMYLSPAELSGLVGRLSARFGKIAMLMDCYSEFAARVSKYKNPINEVGVTKVYGLDEPKALNIGDFKFLKELDMTPESYIDQLKGMENRIFKKLYAGNFARKLYKLYEYRRI